MQVPGPTMIVTEGDTVRVVLTNGLPAAAGNTTLDVIGDQLDRLVDVLLPTNDGLSFSSAVARDC